LANLTSNVKNRDNVGVLAPVIDAWINPNPPELAVGFSESKQGREVVTRVFKHRADEILNGVPMEEMVQRMRTSGIDHGVLTAMPGAKEWPSLREFHDWVAREVKRFPGVFIGSGAVDPREGMEAVRQVERMVRELDFKLVHVMPSLIGLPPTHRFYYPVFAKCVELGVPVCLNCGIPGPLLYADLQHPRHLDTICIDFPELVVIASHMGNPWVPELVAYMAKHENLYLMASAWAPMHYPQPLVEFLNSSRGRDKVMFASDYPLMGFERCMEELTSFPFRNDATRDAFMGANCARVLGWKL